MEEKWYATVESRAAESFSTLRNILLRKGSKRLRIAAYSSGFKYIFAIQLYFW